MWTLIVFTCFSISGLIVYNMTYDYLASPKARKLSVYDGKDISPMPAITICPSDNFAPDLIAFRKWFYNKVRK